MSYFLIIVHVTAISQCIVALKTIWIYQNSSIYQRMKKHDVPISRPMSPCEQMDVMLSAEAAESAKAPELTDEDFQAFPIIFHLFHNK